MKKFVTLMTDSAKELTKVRTIAICAMMMALSSILSLLSIQVNEIIKIGFSFIVDAMVGLMFGPVVGLVYGGAADIIKYFVHPTGAFFPGFTLSAMVGGFICGLVMYKRKISIVRCATAKLLVFAIVNICMNTVWLRIMYHMSWEVLFGTRLIKEAIMYPIETVMFWVVVRAMAGQLNRFGLVESVRRRRAAA